jgi:hypothetical protein
MRRVGCCGCVLGGDCWCAVGVALADADLALVLRGQGLDVGAMARQGAHQTAQKSTRTGRLDLRISASKLDSVTSIVFALAMTALLTMKNGLPR